MAVVKMSAALPDGDANGLNDLARTILADTEGMHIVVGVIATSKVVLDMQTGESTPTMRIVRVESVDQQDAGTLLRVFERAYERRTGQLSMELEDDLREYFTTIKQNLSKDGGLLSSDES